MGDFIQQVLFSDFMILGLVGMVILIITIWSNSLKEYPGYLLGWLVGIFLIVMISTLLPPPPAPIEGTVPVTTPSTITFFGLIIPSIFGLGLGFGLLYAIRIGAYGNSKVGRALTVAALMSFSLTAGYVLLRSSTADRWGLAVFALTFAIGALFNFILTRGSAARGNNLTSRI